MWDSGGESFVMKIHKLYDPHYWKFVSCRSLRSHSFSIFF